MIKNCPFHRLIMLFVLPLFWSYAVAQPFPYQNASLSPKERALDLCGRLTLDEKVGLMICL